MDGAVTVSVFRSLWVQRVNMTGIKGALRAPGYYSSSVHKLRGIPDEIVMANISNVNRRSLQGILALLLLFCSCETHFTDIVLDILVRSVVGILQTGRSPLVTGVVQVRVAEAGEDVPTP